MRFLPIGRRRGDHDVFEKSYGKPASPRRGPSYGALKELGIQVGDAHAMLGQIRQSLAFAPNDPHRVRIRREFSAINVFVHDNARVAIRLLPPPPPAVRFIDKGASGAYLQRARMQERLACFLGRARARAFRALGFSVNGKTRERLAFPSPLAKLLGGRRRLSHQAAAQGRKG